MHLQNQPAAHVFPAQRLIHMHHGQLDNIRCRALHRRIHGSPLAKLPDHLLGRLQLRQVPSASHQGFRITLLLALFHSLLHKRLDPWILGKIPADKLLRFFGGNACILGQAKAADAVNQTEVHCLGAGTQLRRYFVQWHFKDFTGGTSVNILPRAEGFQHGSIPGEVRHQPKLNLAIVRIQQHPAFLRQERLPDFLAFFRAYRNILQVRLRGADAPSGRCHLIEIAVHPSVAVHQAKQTFNVGAVQLHQLPIPKQGLDDFRRNVSQPFQHLGRGGIAPGCFLPVGKLELVKQHFSQLLGTVQIKASRATGIEHLLLCLFNSLGVLMTKATEEVRIHGKACRFHAEKHMAQGHFHLPHERRHVFQLDFLLLLDSQLRNATGIRRQAFRHSCQTVTLHLRIQQVCPQHGIPCELLRQRQAVMVQQMKQMLAVMHHGRMGAQERCQHLQSLHRVNAG